MSYNVSTQSIRPVTSKARGICKYYTTVRGCFSGDRCKFLHGVPYLEGDNDQPLLTPYDKAKRCRYFDKGYCKRGENCWFLHETDKKGAVQDDEEEQLCSICFEKPAMYGLLGGCSHVFCLLCIKKWREPQNKPEAVTESGNTKKCPMCRSSTKFITPSSKFWREGTEQKSKIIKAYMASMAKVPCRYFQKSLKDKNGPICPYGRDCFYGHIKEDGTPYIFKDGVDVCMKRYRTKARRGISSDLMSTLQTYFTYAINRGESSSDHSTPDTQDAPVNDTPTIHRQHNSNGDDDEDGPPRVPRVRNRNSAVMDLLRAAFGITSGLTEWDEIDSDSQRRDGQGSEDQREDEVMETLGMIADEMLASVDAFREDGSSGNDERRPHVPGQPDDYENYGDMPALQSVSSESEDDDEDENVHSESPEDDSEKATETEGIVDVASTRTEDVSASDEEPNEAQIPGGTSNMLEPVDSGGKGIEGSRPSNAFTTDGRGRVISFGDTMALIPSLDLDSVLQESNHLPLVNLHRSLRQEDSLDDFDCS